jgi:hypothetical protein
VRIFNIFLLNNLMLRSTGRRRAWKYLQFLGRKRELISQSALAQ